MMKAQSKKWVVGEHLGKIFPGQFLLTAHHHSVLKERWNASSPQKATVWTVCPAREGEKHYDVSHDKSSLSTLEH